MKNKFRYFIDRKNQIIYSLLALFSFDLQAALPTPVAPSTSPAAGDWLALIEGYVKDSGLVLGLTHSFLIKTWHVY